MDLFGLNSGYFGDEKSVGFLEVAGDELALGDFEAGVFGKDFQYPNVFSFENWTGAIKDAPAFV